MTKVLNFFTVVHWDQRGTALSYNKTVKSSDISFEKIFDDAVCLTEILKKTYQKDKIILIGHSFGSILGIHLAEKFPELYYAYIGIGQVIDDNRSREITYSWLVERLKEDNDTASIAKIKEKHLVPRELINRYKGIYYNDKTLFDVIKTSPYYFDGYLDDYNKSMKFVREANGKPEGKHTFIAIDSITKINIPTYFFEGKHDRIAACAPELVVDFCEKLEAPKKEIIWFENSAHHPNIDEPEKFQNELINIAKKHITPELPHISFSFDDGSTNNISTYDNEDWNSMIRKQLKDNQVQAIWFVAGKAVDNDKGKHLLQRWNDDGHLIGNHTYNHLNYNDSLMTCKSYFENIQKCDSFIRNYENYRKIFRCPYLNAGVTISKRFVLAEGAAPGAPQFVHVGAAADGFADVVA
jgi:pimeloyl-ACP methyl ester carboxylesterase